MLVIAKKQIGGQSDSVGDIPGNEIGKRIQVVLNGFASR
jgi:hypothetical protein